MDIRQVLNKALRDTCIIIKAVVISCLDQTNLIYNQFLYLTIFYYLTKLHASAMHFFLFWSQYDGLGLAKFVSYISTFQLKMYFFSLFISPNVIYRQPPTLSSSLLLFVCLNKLESEYHKNEILVCCFCAVFCFRL